MVFPIVYLVHAHGAAPHVHVNDWPLFLMAIVFASLLASAGGLLIGTVFDPRKITLLFSVIVIPITFLGCVYYPWASLSSIRWLQVFVLVNPLVYMSEGLRIALTPDVPHMGPVMVIGMLGLLATLLTTAAVRAFAKRVVV